MNTSGHFEKVREMAREAGTSVAGLCRRANVNRATVDLWRTGKTSPSFRTWERLERAAAEMKEVQA